MKKASIVLNVVFLGIIIYLLLSKNNSNKIVEEKIITKVDTLLIRDTIPCKEITMLYINTDSLYEKYNMVKDYLKSLKKEQEKLENELISKQKQLESELLVYREEQQYMTEEELRLKEEEFKQKYEGLTILQQELSEKFNTSGLSKNEKVQKAVSEFLTRYSKEKGCNYILGYGMLTPVLYADKDLDVTKEVISRLNKEYKSK